MTTQKKDVNERLEESLIQFVERSVSEKATTVEVEVLPVVAKVLARIIYPNY
ncbi:hypothetical protein [Carnobacterium sp. TMP28]|uniref:hypothetical protein n=1 Tax=Carnobacterium sp. TMP28 TaxID=3397060 RepID=UPI0039E19454